MFTHQIKISFEEPNGSPVGQQVTVSADGKINEADIIVPASSTNLHVLQSIDVSGLKSLLLSSTKPMTVKTNSSGSPDDTITLAANVPVIWYTGCGHPNPLTADVTGLYLTTGDVGEATLTIRGLQDVTP